MTACTSLSILAAMLVALLALTTSLGCASFDKLRGEGFHDDLATSGSIMRPPSTEKRSPWFLSTKANEIDSHFGK